MRDPGNEVGLGPTCPGQPDGFFSSPGSHSFNVAQRCCFKANKIYEIIVQHIDCFHCHTIKKINQKLCSAKSYKR